MIYISKHLGNTDRGRPVKNSLEQLGLAMGIKVKEIPANKNEWCRDYMPVKGVDGRLVLFSYDPHYLRGSKSGQGSRPDQKQICKDLALEYEDATEIILDGGAIEIHGTNGIVSSKFLQLNGDAENTKAALAQKLGLNKLVALPPDPWDFTGHVDGLIRFIDEKRVLINDYSGLEESIKSESRYIQNKYQTWKTAFDKAIDNAGWKVNYLASAFHKNKNASSAKGIYLNFLNAGDCIIMPAYTDCEEENMKAKSQLEDYYKLPVYTIEADRIAEKGGVVNCITWMP